jgi:hypothetical protein
MQIRGLPRREAERAAFDIILIEFLNRAQPDADPNRCASCGKSERPDATLLPFGVGVRHTWLCWEAWRAQRRTEAIGRLAAIGIAEPAKATK